MYPAAWNLSIVFQGSRYSIALTRAAVEYQSCSLYWSAIVLIIHLTTFPFRAGWTLELAEIVRLPISMSCSGEAAPKVALTTEYV